MSANTPDFNKFAPEELGLLIQTLFENLKTDRDREKMEEALRNFVGSKETKRQKPYEQMGRWAARFLSVLVEDNLPKKINHNGIELNVREALPLIKKVLAERFQEANNALHMNSQDENPGATAFLTNMRNTVEGYMQEHLEEVRRRVLVKSPVIHTDYYQAPQPSQKTSDLPAFKEHEKSHKEHAKAVWGHKLEKPAPETPTPKPTKDNKPRPKPGSSSSR